MKKVISMIISIFLVNILLGNVIVQASTVDDMKNITNNETKTYENAAVKSIIASQTEYKVGQYIFITVNFNMPIDSYRVRLELYGAISADDLRAGSSDGTSVTFAYLIDEIVPEGSINVTVKDIYGVNDGTSYSYYTETNICNVSSDIDENWAIKSVESSKIVYNDGEYINITVNFDKPVKSQNVTLDLWGGINAQKLTPIKYDDYSATFSYLVNENNREGEITVVVKDIYGLENGRKYDDYTKANCISINTNTNGSTPVRSIEITKYDYDGKDYVSIYVYFNRPIKTSNVKLDITGGLNVSNLTPGAGDEYCANYLYELNQPIDEPINVNVKSIRGLYDEKMYNNYYKENVFINVIIREDINKDGIVDITDLALVAANYNMSHSNLAWDNRLDINRDDFIDIYDITMVNRKIIS